MNDNRTFYRQIKPEKRKKFRKLFDAIVDSRKKQIAFFDKHFIFPQKKLVLMSKKVLKNELPVEFYLKEEKKLSLYLKEFMERK